MIDLSRREFVSGAAALAGMGSGAALAALGTFPRLRPAHAAERPSLSIPPELRPDAAGEIALHARAGSRAFLAGKSTPTFGINGPFLGPAVRVRRGRSVVMNVSNGIDQDITMHWHGLEIPGDVDGSPYTVIRPGGTWRPTLRIEQPAATCWFHPHFYPTTAEQVIMGLAGLFVIDDEEADALGLPSRWGVDDIPLVLQDRRFQPDGSFFHRFNLVSVTTGYVGDTMLVNGAHHPEGEVARGWLRLRLLNGSNARSYRLAISDGRPMFIVGSDGGLLAEPVRATELTMVAGERWEVLVDARDGKAFDLVTRPVEQMAMNLPPFDAELPLVTLRPTGADGKGELPDTLVHVPPLVENLPPVSRTLTVGMRRDAEGMGLLKEAGLMKWDASKADPSLAAAIEKVIIESPALSREEQLSANTMDGKPFEMGAVPFSAPLGKDLRWVIAEGSDRMLHPVHIHGCRFRILALDGAPPPAHLAGWKDIAPVAKGGTCEIQIRFDHPAPTAAPFMAHCHILEHEDSGMMTNFSVS